MLLFSQGKQFIPFSVSDFTSLKEITTQNHEHHTKKDCNQCFGFFNRNLAILAQKYD